MRGKSLVAILSLALLAGAPLSAQAASTGPSGGGIGNMSANDGGGGGGGSDRGGESGAQNSNAGNDGDGRRPCLETSVYDCPPPPPRKKVVINTPVNDDDCTCRPYPLKVNNQTQIVLDCYETRVINGVERTLYCKRPSQIITR